MFVLYKNQNDSNSRLNDATQDNNNISEDAIIEIQKNFSIIYQTNPEFLDQRTIQFFESIDKCYIDNENIRDSLPKILPYELYGKLISFFAIKRSYTFEENDQIKTFTSENKQYENEIEREKSFNFFEIIFHRKIDIYDEIHRIVSSVIVALTSGYSECLFELQKFNLLNIVVKQIDENPYPLSTNNLIQIINNFLGDENEKISELAHSFFPMDHLLKILEYIKSCYSDHLDNQKVKELYKIATTKSLKSFFVSIYKYPRDITTVQAIIILYELSGYFNLIHEDPDLAISLCAAIMKLFDNNLIHYSDFDKLGFPAFLSSLSCLADVKVKTNAFTVIGKLISASHYNISFNFSQYFNEIKHSNPNTDPGLLESAIFTCNSFFANSKPDYPKSAYEEINSNINILFEIYEHSNYNIKKDIIELFSSYLNYMSHIQIQDLPQFDSALFPIYNLFFRFIEVSDDQDKFNALKYLYEFVEYIYFKCQNKTNQIIQFTSYFLNQVNDLVDSDDDTLSRLAKDIIQQFKNEQDKL